MRSYTFIAAFAVFFLATVCMAAPPEGKTHYAHHDSLVSAVDQYQKTDILETRESDEAAWFLSN